MKPSVQNRAGKNTLVMDVDMRSVNALLSQLGDVVHTAVRPAAQAAAEVFYEEVRKNVRRIGKSSGRLEASIYQKYREERSIEGKRASYLVTWRTAGSGVRAPHGHFLEFGYIQRYATYIGKDGNWYTAVRPSMRGKKLPKRASRAQKDAFFVLRKGGPVQIAAKPFVRPALAKTADAVSAAQAEVYRRIDLYNRNAP